MSTLNDPTIPEEIALVMGITKRSVERKAHEEGWNYSELPGRGRYKKRLYALKDLPKAIHVAIFSYRFTQENNHGQSTTTGQAGQFAQLEIHSDRRRDDGRADRRNTGSGNLFDTVPDRLPVEGGHCTRLASAVVGPSKEGGVCELVGDTGLLRPVDSGRAGVTGVPAMQGAGTVAIYPANPAGPSKAVLAVNRTGSSAGDLAPARRGRLPAVAEPSRFNALASDDAQRVTDGARQLLLQFAEHHPGSMADACEFLSTGYANGSLPDELVTAIEQCNDKVNADRLGKIALSTISKWKQLKKTTGHCLPEKTRQKVDWQTVWWMPLFLSCYRKPQKPKVTEAYQAFAQDWQAQGLNTGDMPSYSSINTLLMRVPRLIRETGRCTGSDLAALKSFIRRDWSGSSNEVWVGDGHTFKAKVRHPETGKAFAPEVTVIIDAASRFIVGWAFSLSENQIAVSEALGQGMIKHGKPLIYYSDNGSGQTAKTIDCPAGGMLARLGVVHETGIPGNPQGRGLIEGLWDITAIAVAKTFPTFQGTGMDGGALRKVTAAINSAKLKGEVPDFVPTWQAFMAACEARFDWYNHEHKHVKHGGNTPASVYFANFDLSWACRLTPEEEINLYRPFIERTPNRGEIRWINNLYHCELLVGLPSKTKVRVAYDMHNADHVWISDLQGKFIGIGVWKGNEVRGFPVPYTDDLKEKRIDGMVKRKQQGIDDALAEGGNVIDGEVLQRIEVIPQALEVPLIRVPVIPKEVEAPLKNLVIEGDFNRQEPEEKTMTAQETTLMIERLMAAKKAAEE